MVRFSRAGDDVSDSPSETTPDVAEAVARLHDDVDDEVAPLVARYEGRLQCRRGCHGCCVDDLTVFEVEAARIREAFPEVLQGEPGAIGGCAFLDADGGCRIYAARPYVCRTQGLPLRWTDQSDDGGVVEYRDICPLNDAGQAELGIPDALEALPPDGCWSLGRFEGRLAMLQARRSEGRLARIALRALFESADDQA